MRTARLLALEELEALPPGTQAESLLIASGFVDGGEPGKEASAGLQESFSAYPGC